MITATSLTHPGYLRRIKASILRAVVKANKPGAHRPIGHDQVYSAKGRCSLDVRAWRGGGIEIIDCHDNDVTPVVMAALRRYHSGML